MCVYDRQCIYIWRTEEVSARFIYIYYIRGAEHFLSCHYHFSLFPLYLIYTKYVFPHRRLYDHTPIYIPYI